MTISQILTAGLDDWRVLAVGLQARFRTSDFATGLAFVNAVGAAAEQVNHHPDVTLSYPWVDLTLLSHDVGRLTDRDVALAGTISAIAAEQGIAADPAVLAEVEIGLNTADLAAQGPFWAALLTGDPGNIDGDDVRDPTGRVPQLWFQATEPHDPPRQRFHLDVWVPHDVADTRIAAALAAGGTVVDDSKAPSFTVLRDPEGNRVCVCTCLDRDGSAP